MTALQNKILGCLYGQALGDAFAMPAQVHPDDTARSFGWLDSWQAAPDDHIVHAGLQPGASPMIPSRPSPSPRP